MPWATNAGGWILTTSSTTNTTISGNWYVYARPLQYYYGTPPMSWAPSPQFVPAAQQLLHEQAQADLAAHRIIRRRAIDRAERLLQESLSPAQREELGQFGHFTVAAQHADGRPALYRLTLGRVANIHEVNAQGRLVARWCVHPRLNVPDADTMLAQKLWLENHPDELLAIANRHPI